MSRIKLFCLPYAGGSSLVFRQWQLYISPGIELVPVELAGRGTRIQEIGYKNAAEAVDDVFASIQQEIDQSPYSLFGHSMGCMIIYDLAQKIRGNGLRPPLHLFFSGRGAPSVKRNEKKYHLLNDEDFRTEILALGGTPPELFEHAELMDLFIPLLKNDFRISEEENKETKIDPFDTDITVLMGKEDDLTPEQCDGWKKHTRRLCSTHYFNGGHFFLHHHMQSIVGLINAALVGNISQRDCNTTINAKKAV